MDINRTFVRQFLQVFLPMTAALLIVAGIFYRNEVNANTALIKADEQHKVRIALEIISNQINSLGDDALYLSHQQNLLNWINGNNPGDKRATEQDMALFASRHPRYDQIRYLDAQGSEVIRLENRNGTIYQLPNDNLQDKAHRYYVKAVQSLQDNQLYVSPFDLNMEQGVILQPLKPVIRIGTPVYDQQGNFRGSIVLNYLGQHLLDALRALNPANDLQQIWLLNREGYWLLGPSAEQEWGFMWPERQQQRLQTYYPQLWEQLQNNANGVITSEEGLFTHLQVAVNELLPNKLGNTWHLLAFTPQQYIQQALSQSLQRLLAFVLLSLLIIVVLSWLIARKESARARSEQQLREQEARYRNLLEGAPDAIVIVNQQGEIRLINTAAENAFGYPRQELIGEPVEILIPERFHNHQQHRQGYTANPTVRPMGESQELFARRKDGSELPVEISLSPMVLQEEKLVTAVIRDVSTRKERDKWIKELNRKLVARSISLQAINQELESFSYSVSHDLRAPLRAVDGFSKTILSDYGDKLDERGRDRLERIRAAAQRMGHLIDDLLTLARISRSDIHKTRVDVTTTAQEICDDLRLLHPDRQVTVEIQPDMTSYADSRLFTIALTNLLSNAWKFSAKVEDARIFINCEEDKSEKIFIIKDNGAGFNANSAGKLFGAFQRFHSAKDFEGTGIGLATVQRIVHKHGGRIWVESQEGQGATFYFSLGQS